MFVHHILIFAYPVDIPIFNAPWGGLRIEDGYLITETGAQPLHDTPFVIRR